MCKCSALSAAGAQEKRKILQSADSTPSYVCGKSSGFRRLIDFEWARGAQNGRDTPSDFTHGLCGFIMISHLTIVFRSGFERAEQNKKKKTNYNFMILLRRSLLAFRGVQKKKKTPNEKNRGRLSKRFVQNDSRFG